MNGSPLLCVDCGRSGQGDLGMMRRASQLVPNPHYRLPRAPLPSAGLASGGKRSSTPIWPIVAPSTTTGTDCPDLKIRVAGVGSILEDLPRPCLVCVQ